MTAQGLVFRMQNSLGAMAACNQVAGHEIEYLESSCWRRKHPPIDTSRKYFGLRGLSQCGGAQKQKCRPYTEVGSSYFMAMVKIFEDAGHRAADKFGVRPLTSEGLERINGIGDGGVRSN
ncbi:hypothetical protein DFH09DRAFT_1103322 [Mycena vulgaris]|nr:hypothetical protein DFH09DRAFT_1103322 [Mycena vulgaris]